MSKSILIYANCQGEELRTTGHYLQTLAGQVTFKWIPLHKVNLDDWDRLYGPEFMSDVAVVWEQVETGPPSEHRQQLHRRIPADCQIVKYPPFSALCLWPFTGNDPRIAQDPLRYPWSDAIAAVLATESHLSDNALFDKYMQITRERMPDLARRLRLDVARWRAADAIADIKASDWVEANFTTTKLFHASGHLTAAPARFMLTQLLRHTTLIEPRQTEAAIYEIEVLLRHHEGQDFECVPVHPLVAERLNLKFYDPDARYRWHGHEWTFRQYILHYIRWSPYLD